MIHSKLLRNYALPENIHTRKLVGITISNAELDTAQPTFQCRINVVSTLWINVEMTLMQRWKWNKIRRRIFNVVQRRYNVGVRRWNNVESTLHNVDTAAFQRRTTSFQHCFNVDVALSQRCFNVASTSVKAISKPIWLVKNMDLHKYW